MSDKPRSREQVSGKRTPFVRAELIEEWMGTRPGGLIAETRTLDERELEKTNATGGEFFEVRAAGVDSLWVRCGEENAQMIFVAGGRRYSFTVGSRSGRAKVAMTVDFVEEE